MLRTLLQLFGVDLEQKISELKVYLHELIEGGTSRVNERLKDAGVTVGIVLAGVVAASATVASGLAALFLWLDRSHGPLIALAAVGGVTAFIAVVMFAIASQRSKPKLRVAAPRPSVVFREESPSRESPNRASQSRASSPPLDLSVLVPPPPSNASIVDILAHRVSHRAAAASDEAIDAASEFVRSGSRGALVATLTIVGLVGILIGRRHSVPGVGPHH